MDDHFDLDLDRNDGLDLVEPGWWSAASLLTVEAAAIAALTFALLGMFGGATVASVVAQAVVGDPWSPADVRWDAVVSAGVALLFVLAALLLGRRVVVAEEDVPPWSGHLARAAVVVAIPGAVLTGVAILAGVLRGPAGP